MLRRCVSYRSRIRVWSAGNRYAHRRSHSARSRLTHLARHSQRTSRRNAQKPQGREAGAAFHPRRKKKPRLSKQHRHHRLRRVRSITWSRRIQWIYIGNRTLLLQKKRFPCLHNNAQTRLSNTLLAGNSVLPLCCRRLNRSREGEERAEKCPLRVGAMWPPRVANDRGSGNYSNLFLANRRR